MLPIIQNILKPTIHGFCLISISVSLLNHSYLILLQQLKEAKFIKITSDVRIIIWTLVCTHQIFSSYLAPCIILFFLKLSSLNFCGTIYSWLFSNFNGVPSSPFASSPFSSQLLNADEIRVPSRTLFYSPCVFFP